MFVYNLLIVLVCGEVVSKQPWEKNTKVNKNKDKIYEERLETFSSSSRLARNRTLQEIKEEKKKEFWDTNAAKVIQEKLKARIIENAAKNVILFLGDGMSIPTVTATRVYMGGEEIQLAFERFPYTALSKTYCVDHQTADSACTATAYLGGVKANLATIGVTADVEQENCTASNNPENKVDSIARLFQLNGKKTGLVTTMRVTHASPAGVYAHTAYRHWESDSDVLESHEDPQNCQDIASQLVFGETGKNLNVILGGGRNKFYPKYNSDEKGTSGDRSDRRNLILEWMEQKEKLGLKHQYVSNRKQLLNVNNETEYLLGLFDNSHMQYNLERDNETQPSLEEMTEAAIKILQKGSKGFFLFVEGGKIDKGHHESTPHKALDETAEFSKAVQKAVELTKEEDTLIVVTADHSHTMTMAGHAKRGGDVFGYGGVADDNNFYTILSYANGPGYRRRKNKKRYVASLDEMTNINFKWPSTAPLSSETHGADDVGIYARGPWAHLFTGVLEQNVIPHIMAFASCVSKTVSCSDYLKEKDR